jgi:elongation factor Ts
LTTITLDQIKELRELTGAGVMDCKRALEASDGDKGRAVKFLMDQGIAMAEKRADRVTAQGLIDSYIHAGRIGAIVEVNCETDFVARTADFQSLVHEIAMQVVAQNPLVVSREELPDGHEEPVEKVVLLEQPYIRDPSRTVRQLINETIGKTGENIQVKRFQRFELGE